MKLTIKAIIRWEQLSKKPFADLDYRNEDDIASLFYVCSMSDNNSYTFDEFKENTDEATLTKMAKDFDRETLISAQFKQKQPEIETDVDTESSHYAVYLKDIVPILILSGLDANYAMNEMSLCDLPLYIEAYEKKTREKLEAERLWTYMSLLPNLSKKTQSPSDLYPFPWEQKQRKEAAAKTIEKDGDMLNAFMNSGRSILE